MLNIQLYNKLKNSAGYIGSDGLTKHDLDAYWVVTDFMQVTPKSKCSYNGITYATPNQYGAFYDEFQNFISTFTINAEDTELIIPENVFYVRFSLCRNTKINMFSSPLEIGSINEISGGTEAGDAFRRTTDYVENIIPGTTYTVSTTNTVKQIVIYYYREALDGTILYAHRYSPTPFDASVDASTFTVPTDAPGINRLKAKFYNPDNIDFEVMLNAGETALPYMPYSSNMRDDTNTFNFFIYGEAYEGFREELYEWIKTTLSPNLTEGDLDIIIKLMCYIFGDLSGLVYNLKSQIDPDLAEESYLKHLGTIIGYEWNDGLTAEEQRESMKLYVDLQKKRGTKFSLKNLIAVFGQTRSSYYSTSDLRGVKITEGGKNGEPVGTEDSNGLYPGDIMIEMPVFSNILINAIDNIRLIGTRIFFTYVIYCGPFKIGQTVDAGHELNLFFDPAYWGYDPTIEEFINIATEETGSDTINSILDWPILHQRVKNCQANTCCVVYTSYAEPFEKGFIWHPAGNTNYQGFLIDDDTLKEEDQMYGYGH